MQNYHLYGSRWSPAVQGRWWNDNPGLRNKLTHSKSTGKPNDHSYNVQEVKKSQKKEWFRNSDTEWKVIKNVRHPLVLIVVTRLVPIKWKSKWFEALGRPSKGACLTIMITVTITKTAITHPKASHYKRQNKSGKRSVEKVSMQCTLKNASLKTAQASPQGRAEETKAIGST